MDNAGNRLKSTVIECGVQQVCQPWSKTGGLRHRCFLARSVRNVPRVGFPLFKHIPQLVSQIVATPGV